MSCNSVSQPGSWIKKITVKARTTGSGNISFNELTYGKAVILRALCDRDMVAIPYYHSPTRNVLGVHVIKDADTYTAVANTEVTVSVWYYETS